MTELTIIQPRPKALTQDDFNKLETLVNKNFDLKEKYIFGGVKTVDEYGIHKTERGIVGTELELIPKNDINPQLMESLRRPFSNPSIGVQLARLSIHVGFKGGDFGLQVVTEDAIRDLDGKSEWAVVKACESFRTSGEDFFCYAKFIELVNRYHNSLFNKENKIETIVEENNEDEFVLDTDEQKAQVKELIENALKRIEK